MIILFCMHVTVFENVFMKKIMCGSDFIERSKIVHGDKYDYNLVDYKNSVVKVTITCQLHGNFEQRPRHHIEGQGCPTCGELRRAESVKGSRILRERHKLTNSYSIHEFIQRARETHGDKYDYSITDYRGSQRFVIIICPNHGQFNQQAGSHMYGQGCPKCATQQTAQNRIQKSRETFVEKAIAAHGDKYDYSLTDYIGVKTKVIIICRIHGEFKQRPDLHLSGQDCPECKK